MLGHVRQRLEIAHRVHRLDGVFALVVLAGLLVEHALRIQPEVLDHEGVHRLPLQELVAVAFLGEVRVLRLGLRAAVFLNGADERVLDLRRVLRPVAADGN